MVLNPRKGTHLVRPRPKNYTVPIANMFRPRTKEWPSRQKTPFVNKALKIHTRRQKRTSSTRRRKKARNTRGTRRHWHPDGGVPKELQRTHCQSGSAQNQKKIKRFKNHSQKKLKATSPSPKSYNPNLNPYPNPRCRGFSPNPNPSYRSSDPLTLI